MRAAPDVVVAALATVATDARLVRPRPPLPLAPPPPPALLLAAPGGGGATASALPKTSRARDTAVSVSAPLTTLTVWRRSPPAPLAPNDFWLCSSLKSAAPPTGLTAAAPRGVVRARGVLAADRCKGGADGTARASATRCGKSGVSDAPSSHADGGSVSNSRMPSLATHASA